MFAVGFKDFLVLCNRYLFIVCFVSYHKNRFNWSLLVVIGCTMIEGDTGKIVAISAVKGAFLMLVLKAIKANQQKIHQMVPGPILIILGSMIPL